MNDYASNQLEAQTVDDSITRGITKPTQRSHRRNQTIDYTNTSKSSRKMTLMGPSASTASDNLQVSLLGNKHIRQKDPKASE